MITAERLDRDALAAVQGRRLAELIAAIYGRNAFYTQKLDAAGLQFDRLQFPRDLDSQARLADPAGTEE